MRDTLAPQSLFVPGAFVQVLDSAHVIAKLVARHGNDVEIEYFHSVAKQSRTLVPQSKVRRFYPSRQTRCYVRTQDRWLVGRIGRHDGNKYEVILPHSASYIDEGLIYVRSYGCAIDPLDVLIAEGQDTPFFHACRFDLIKEFTRQRGACGGITALLAAKIEYYAHQTAVVRRILDDPIQRYLLADEVGLGKTIESGLILKQLLLDAPVSKSLILVPRILIEQWRDELENRLAIAVGVDSRVDLQALEDAPKLAKVSRFDMLIIDEAQHAVTGAFETNSTAKTLYDSVCHMAHVADRLLLLSATPLLNHEQDFLAMLHLLDPLRYILSDLDSFRDRVGLRQRIGRHLLQLHEGVDPFLAELAGKQIRNEFPDDVELGRICDSLLRVLEEPSPRFDDISRCVRSIKVHLSENYRLHRRLIRHRRTGEIEACLLPRMNGSSDVHNGCDIYEYDIDERSEQLEILLEEWRQKALESRMDRTKLAAIFTTLIECASTELSALTRWASVRRGGKNDKWLGIYLGERRAQAIHSLSLFPGEVMLLKQMEKLAAKGSEEGDRIALLTEVIASAIRRKPGKIVVFIGYTPAAHTAADVLGRNFGDAAVIRHTLDMNEDDITLAIESFGDDPKCRVLVCDASAEEGRNFQHANTMVLFDLPWSPNRIEQRLGRVDRIGRREQMAVKVLAGYEGENCGLAASWCQLLADGFAIFSRSVASLQFFIDREMLEIERVALEFGAAGLRERIPTTQKGIQTELRNIAEYDLLDTVDIVDAGGRELTLRLEEVDRHVDCTIKAVEQWAMDALRMQRVRADSERRTVRYSVTENCLLPQDTCRHLVPLVRREGTYYRSTACAKPDLALLRLGDEFLETLQTNIEWDDRGQSFAMWRCEPKWARVNGDWTGFRFDFRVETDTDQLRELPEGTEVPSSAQTLLRRRGDGALPPFVQSVFVNLVGEAVTDPELLAILARKYRKIKDGGTDVGMHAERAKLVYKWVDPLQWPQVCAKARNAAESHIRNSSLFVDTCRKARVIAERQVQTRLQQLRLRITYERKSSHARALERALVDFGTEEFLSRALIAGVSNPRVALDAVGFIVIAAQPAPVVNHHDL